ncbi:glycosyltransferase involved in cell wall biosynthesis [Humitalea rosea]|uniref:Glycosyltransferase involved in cell wall biosynthesis n=1 Tax=Humitalea rosea TaxID=990373 RepID=A0A2W7IGH8_9PROT|nr:glycosyltransferase [Humitalea rosea]PZW45871.1 glycosyltransferase involved in cell wall biosynthesis [Humitalea rosea]
MGREAEPSGHRPAPAVVFLDVTLSLLHGGRLPVGIIRVEQDIARRLLARRDVALRLVVFDRRLRAYRAATPAEKAMLGDILAGAFTRLVPETAETDPAGTDGHALRALRLGLATVRELANGLRRLLGRLARTPPNVIAAQAEAFVRRRLPPSAGGAVSHALRAGLRNVLIAGLRAAHLILVGGAGVGRVGRHLAARLTRCPLPAADAQAPLSPDLPPDAVLVIAGNPWDWLDFDHLDRMVRERGLKVISVVYDVIAVDLPWATPGTPDIYHRFFVEMGHLAHAIVTISAYTAERYRAVIATPNDLSPRLSSCLLPVGLAEELVPLAVPALEGQRFVLYVSTIEARKNHRLLIDLWERLRQELPPGTLPALVFVGQWGWGTADDRNRLERNWRLRPHLRVLSRVGDAELAWLYRSAMFTVFPSHAEGFGLGAAESLAFGTPCIISTCPALVEATEGLMPALDPLDFPAWHAMVSRLVTDPAALEALRRAAGRFRPVPRDAFADHLAEIALAAVA